MTIELTLPEEAMFNDLRIDKETVEVVFHRVLRPMVEKHAESRLQRLADEYRALTPDLQLEALAVLKTWKESKA
jgi:hypothetical protein